MTREEFYELVWTTPMWELTMQYGLINKKIREECETMNIPLPSMSYWSLYRKGKPVERTPLETGHKSNINDRYAKKLEELGQLDGKLFKVPEKLSSKNSIVLSTKDRIRLGPIDSKYMMNGKRIYPFPIYFVSSPKELDRAMRIFYTIMKCVKSLGYRFSTYQHYAYIRINNINVKVDIVERSQNLTKVLSFRIIQGRYSLKEFRDTPFFSLEQKILQIVAFLEASYGGSKESNKVADITRERRQEEEQAKRREFEKNKQKEMDRMRSFALDAWRLEQANRFRNYLTSYERFLTDNDSLTQDAITEISWATKKIEWLDPLINRDDEFFNEDDLEELFFKVDLPSSSSYGYASQRQIEFWRNSRHKKRWWE